VYLSNELHDLLVSKDVTGFCNMWNAKMCVSKTSQVIDGITDSVVIAQRFADSFMNNGTPVYDNNYANMSSFISALHTAETSDNMNIKHVDIEMVSKCLAKMKKCKAPVGIVLKQGIWCMHIPF